MVRYFCDACGKETTDNERMYDIPFMKHIIDKNLGYVKIDGDDHQPISGISINKQVCLKCYNEIMFHVFDKFEEIKNRKNDK